MIFAPGSTSQSIDVEIADDAGLPVTGLVAATFPAITYSKATNVAAAGITLSDLAAITTAWTSGGVKERSGGVYRLDLPDAVLSTAAKVTLIGSATGKRLIAPRILVQNVPANTTQFGGTDGSFAAGRPEVNTSHWRGTALPAPATAGYPAVIFKVGTGTGELNLSSGKAPATLAATDVTGNVPANLVTVLGAAPTMLTTQADIGTDNRVLISADAHTSGVTITGIISAGITAIAGGVWNALTSGIVTAGSVGKRLLDFVTTLVYAAPPSAGSNASAVRTELATELGRLDATVSSRHSATQQTADIAMQGGWFADTITAINTRASASALTTAQGSLTKFETMIVLDGAVYQFTANAMELAPSSGSDGPTADEIAAATAAALAGQKLTYTNPVDVDDDERLKIVAGDDYSSGSGRIPTWTVTNYLGPALSSTGKLRLLKLVDYEKLGTDAVAEVEIDVTIATASTTLTITAPLLTETQSMLLSTSPPLDADSHQYQLIGRTSSGSKDITLKLALATVMRRIAPGV